jgi:hypothetical protein
MRKTPADLDRDQRLTDEEMNELVFVEVFDPSAWGEPTFVHASKGPRRIERAKAFQSTSKTK